MDYAAALRQYQKYGRGRSMKKLCEDEGYDYWRFCKLAREGEDLSGLLPCYCGL